MRPLASCFFVLGLALAAAGCGSSRKAVVADGPIELGGSNVTLTVPKGIRVGPGPFILNGGGTTGGQSGLAGDGGDGPGGTSIGCLNGRRYTDAIGIQNSTKSPLRLIAASLTNPDHSIVARFVVRYRKSRHARRQRLTIPADKLVVVPGPTKHVCTPVSGSAYLVATDVSCAFAQRAAPLCRTMHNGGWLGCTVDGTFWECGRFAGPGFPLSETCYLPHQKSHWFTVTWVAPGLGLWGAIQNRRANIGWPVLDAWHVTKGFCEDRPAGMPLVFESSALRILSGRYATRVPTDAHVKFVLRNYRGRGRWSAKGATVQVLIGRHGNTIGTDVGTGGRLTILHADKGSVSGTVYANLRQRNGTKESELNGTWSCRLGTG
jgi:hypothetical protein